MLLDRCKIVRNSEYDFIDQSYSTIYPHIHKYPATMLPQIGIKLLSEFKCTNGVLMDPFCGSGSSISSALHFDYHRIYGYDLNPLAILISKAKFTMHDSERLAHDFNTIQNQILDSNFSDVDVSALPFKNINFWFSFDTQVKLSILIRLINSVNKDNILFKIALSEIIRDSSYTRNNEFKLYRMPLDKLFNFTPDVYSMFLNKLSTVIKIYELCYMPALSENKIITLFNNTFIATDFSDDIDVVLTSPPYGDSRTTVAYGQFSNFSNEYLDEKINARQLDTNLMGGKKSKSIISDSIVTSFIKDISIQSMSRALEVSSFYQDLSFSIQEISQKVKAGGYVFYIVGNRTVKNINLPTDQFIAEQFIKNNFTHIVTYERLISNKSMPKVNSPTNIKGEKVTTMNNEYIVVCRKGHY